MRTRFAGDPVGGMQAKRRCGGRVDKEAPGCRCARRSRPPDDVGGTASPSSWNVSLTHRRRPSRPPRHPRVRNGRPVEGRTPPALAAPRTEVRDGGRPPDRGLRESASHERRTPTTDGRKRPVHRIAGIRNSRPSSRSGRDWDFGLLPARLRATAVAAAAAPSRRIGPIALARAGAARAAE